MVTFSHDDNGTSAETWSAHGRDDLPVLQTESFFAPQQRLLLLAAHPDDETLGAAGLIRQALSAGTDVHIMMCSSGEASHPDSPTHTPAQLAAVRKQELAAALNVLKLDGPNSGTLSWEFLDLPDGKLPAAREEIRAAAQECITSSTNLLVSTYRHDGHCDHEVLGQIATDLASEHGTALLEFPLWYWHWVSPDADQRWKYWHRVPLDPQLHAVKQAALAEHHSQVAPLSDQAGDERLLSVGFIAHFEQPYEVFRYTPAGLKDSGVATRTFDALYRSQPDPWNYRDSPYEHRKRFVTAASLQQPRYESVLELGCSIGISTAELARRAAHLTAIDASATALEQARKNTADCENVNFHQATLPRDWPELPHASYDLAVVSEIGYYLAHDELHQLLKHIADVLRPGGELLLCHWLHHIEGWSLSGADVHDLVQQLGWSRLVEHRERDFLLEIFQRPDEPNREDADCGS